MGRVMESKVGMWTQSQERPKERAFHLDEHKCFIRNVAAEPGREFQGPAEVEEERAKPRCWAGSRQVPGPCRGAGEGRAPPGPCRPRGHTEWSGTGVMSSAVLSCLTAAVGERRRRARETGGGGLRASTAPGSWGET